MARYDEGDGRRVLLLPLGGVGRLVVRPLVRAGHWRPRLEPGAAQGAEGIQVSAPLSLGMRGRGDVPDAVLSVVRPAAAVALPRPVTSPRPRIPSDSGADT